MNTTIPSELAGPRPNSQGGRCPQMPATRLPSPAPRSGQAFRMENYPEKGIERKTGKSFSKILGLRAAKPPALAA